MHLDDYETDACCPNTRVVELTFPRFFEEWESFVRYMFRDIPATAPATGMFDKAHDRYKACGRQLIRKLTPIIEEARHLTFGEEVDFSRFDVQDPSVLEDNPDILGEDLGRFVWRVEDQLARQLRNTYQEASYQFEEEYNGDNYIMSERAAKLHAEDLFRSGQLIMERWRPDKKYNGANKVI